MREREPVVEALRTKHARKFTTLADEVTECFDGQFFGEGDYAVELMAPEGVSTAGGKQALQHLRLRSRKGAGDVVAGSVNAFEKWAELRTFEHAQAVHQRRFQSPLPIDAAAWEAFLLKAEDVLQLAGIPSKRVAPPADLLEDVGGASVAHGEGSPGGASGARRGRGGRPQRIPPALVATFVVVTFLALAVAARVVQTLWFRGNP